jgi:nicotinate-nucleotide adenylyltransferase
MRIGMDAEASNGSMRTEGALGGCAFDVPKSVCPQFDDFGREDPSRMYRLGLMGGTFDPIHTGHLACAEQARVTYGLDGVMFIPTGNPAFKCDRQVTPARTRLLLCHLACSFNPRFGVSSIEVDREGVTYTADTLRQLRAFYPDNVELYFITGADAVLSILKWRDSEAIADMAHLIAATRPGSEITQEFKDEIRQRTNFDVHYLETPALSISSSMLREFVAAGKSIRYLVPLSVYNYVTNSKLYLPRDGRGR